MGTWAQTPCGTNFTGFDPCSAEILGTASTCAGSQETFQTNTCLGTNPSTSSCGLAAGANIVWATFTVSVADTYTITWTASNNRNIRLGLYQYTDPCIMGGETEVACANNGGAGIDETISIFLAAGIYYVCGESSGNLDATSQICVSAPNIPSPIVASDCAVGVNVCTNLNFAIDPNGEGVNILEIPAPGTLGNPMYDGFSTFNPWGTLNYGCLQISESNSTWMKVNIAVSGNLEFCFGGNGTQSGFYDWIMYPASSDCADVLAYNADPVRCNWNLVDYGGTGLANTIPVGGDAGNFEPSFPVLSGEVYIICFSNYSLVQTAVPLEFSGSAVVSCTPLPVDFSFISATLSDEIIPAVNIDWTTVSENNSDYFSVERRTKYTPFESIESVQASGQSEEELKYQLEDYKPIPGQANYYRIKQYDFDGAFKYSNEVSVFVSSENDYTFYPNPSNGLIHVMSASMSDDLVEIRLTDLAGRTVQSSNSKFYGGAATADFSTAPFGIYIIELIIKDVIITQERVVIK